MTHHWDRPRQDRTRRRDLDSFRGTILVTTLCEQYPARFTSRYSALKFGRNLHRQGIIKGLYGTSSFEDTDQLYTWGETEPQPSWQSRKNTPNLPLNGFLSSFGIRRKSASSEQDNAKIVESVKDALTFRGENPTTVKTFIKDLDEDITDRKSTHKSDRYFPPSSSDYINHQVIQETSVKSTYTSNNSTYGRFKDKFSSGRPATSNVMASREHDSIPEEEPSMERTPEGNSLELELAPRLSEPSSRTWQESQYCYSDNEKQLIEEMNKMKVEHKGILTTYEERITKLMTRMHELKGIAEMLENSGTKASPYGVLPTRANLLSFIGARLEQERKQATAEMGGTDFEGPPPLPPRPGRSSKVYPNKPIIHPRVKMKPLEWTRLILKETGDSNTTAIWHTMMEPKLEPDEIERLFQSRDVSGTESLYEDMSRQRGKTKSQLTTLLDVEKSRRAVYTMKALPCTLDDVITTMTSLETSNINSDRFAELLELIGGGSEIDKVQFHVRRKTSASLDYPEYLLFELSKLNHCKERMDFLRFRYRIQWHLFETEQQLKELHTACDEITNSLALKNLLETLLAAGNYLNGGMEIGQADGYKLDILNKLKEIHDRDSKGNLLEFVLKLYCQCYEVEIELGCPTRFRLPEPSNMRHAAQVSFENIHEALSNMKAEVKSTREKFLAISSKEKQEPRDVLWTTAENFMTSALEMIVVEDKLLLETKEIFTRTVAYFMLNAENITPQQFFQIWATFLHDCKYYWKLAHRKIGKERFEIDFKHRGQMSVNSLHGYETFRANMMRRLDTLKGAPEPNSSTLEHPKKHTHAWGLDHERSEATHGHNREEFSKSHMDALYKSPSSPKPLTSEPPSELHKPLAKTPTTVLTENEEHENNGLHNYENQNDLEKVVKESGVENIVGVTNDVKVVDTQGKRINDKQSSFPFVSWLKRDPAKRNNSGDSKSSQDSHKFTEQEGAKRQSNPASSNGLSKIRNTTVHKLSTTPTNLEHSSNEQLDTRDPLNVPSSQTREPLSLPLAHVPPHIPLRVTVNEGDISPYETSMGRDSRPAPYRIDQRYATHTGGSSTREFRGRYELGRMPATVSKARNGSTVSTEYAALYHTPPFNAPPIDKDGYASPTVIRQQYNAKSDINNNTASKNSNVLNSARVIGRTRAPIVLGSNTSISDVYAQSDRENTGNSVQSNREDTVNSIQSTRDNTIQKRVEFDLRTEISRPDRNVPFDSSHVFQQTPTKVPYFGAKRINNYENQGRLEKPALAVKHRADPVLFPVGQTPRELTDTYPKATRSHGIRPSQTGSLQNSPVKDSNLRVSDRFVSNTQDISQTPSRGRDPPTKPSRNLQLNFQDLRKEENKFKSPTLAHANPISNLINRFEKKPNTNEIQNSEMDTQQGKTTMAMTSTTMTYKQPLVNEHDQSDPPPPIPPRADLSFQDNYPSDSLESRSSRGKGSNIRPNHEHNKYLSNGTPHGDQQNSSSVDNTFLSYNSQYKEQVTPTSPPVIASPLREDIGPLSTPMKGIHIREDTGLSEQDDGYKERLRKAAASSSVFDRYTKKQSTPQYSKHNNNIMFSTPQYSRQNNNTQSLSTQSYSQQTSLNQSISNQSYSRQSSLNPSQTPKIHNHIRQNGYLPQHNPNHLIDGQSKQHPITHLTDDQDQFHKTNSHNVNSPQTPNHRQKDVIKTHTSQYPLSSPYTRNESNNHQDNASDPQRPSPSATAVVSPTMRYQDSVSYMDI